MKKLLFCISTIVVLALMVCPAFAHPGGTDSQGGHTDHSTGEYHYHHGYSAHQHKDLDGDGDLDCPYDFVDNTKPSSSTNSSSHSSYDYSYSQDHDHTESAFGTGTEARVEIETKPATSVDSAPKKEQTPGWIATLRALLYVPAVLLIVIAAAGALVGIVVSVLWIVSKIKGW